MSEEINEKVVNAENSNENEDKNNKKDKKSGILSLLDIFITLAVSLIIALSINIFIFSLIEVNKTSMLPNFQDNDVVCLNKTAYWFKAPQSGDVVIFHRKNIKGENVNYIKRVIGIPGDRIEIHDGNVYRNGVLLDEPYIKENTEGTYDEIIPEGKYFVMGDNRNVSLDSKSSAIGLVDKKEIMGKVVFKFRPFEKVQKYTHNYADKK